MRLLLKKQLHDAMHKILLYLAIFIIIVCGMIFYSGFTGALNNIDYSINNFYQEMNLADYEIISYSNFKETELTNLTNYFKNNNISYNLVYNENKLSTNALYHRNDTSINNYQITKGSNPLTNQEIVLNESYATTNNYNIGDYIILNNKAYKLVGYAKFPNHIFIGNIFPAPDSNYIAITYDEISLAKVNTIYLDTTLSEENINNILNNYITTSYSLTAQKDAYSYNRVKDDLALVNAILFIFPIACFISIVIILFINYNRIIDEEKPYIGILKANGFKISKIYLSLLVIPISLVLIASIIGSILGIVLIPPLYTKIILNYYELPTIISANIFTSIILPIILLLFTTFVTISIPILLTIRKVPTDLLKTDAEAKFGRTFLRKVNIPYHIKLIIRNIITSKRKNICLIIASALLLGIVLAVFYVSDSLNYSSTKVNIFNGKYSLSLKDNGTLFKEDSPIDDYKFYVSYAAKPEKLANPTSLLTILDAKDPAIKLTDSNDNLIDITNEGIYLASSYQDSYNVGDEFNIYLNINQYQEPYKIKIAGFFKEVASLTLVTNLDTIKTINNSLYLALLNSNNYVINLKENKTIDALHQYIEDNYDNTPNIHINEVKSLGKDELLDLNDHIYNINYNIPLDKYEEFGIVECYEAASLQSIILDEDLTIKNIKAYTDDIYRTKLNDGLYLPISYQSKVTKETIDIYIDKHIYSFKIAGYINDNNIYCSENYLKTFEGLEDKLTPTNYYKVNDNFNISTLKDYLIMNMPYQAYSLNETSTFNTDKLGLLNDLINITKIIANILAGIIFVLLIYNIGVIGLNNRLQDIKCFKSAGLKSAKLKHMLSIENIVVVIIGALLSIPVGIYISTTILNDVYKITDIKILFYQDIISLLIIIFVSIILMLITSFLINKKIEKMNLATLLKGE